MRPTSLVIVAAVALLGLLALLDAVRGPSIATSRPTSTESRQAEVETIVLEPQIEERAEVQRRLRNEGVVGTLFMTDEECRLRALSLPRLRWVLDSGAEGEECEFGVAPDSRRVVRFGGGIAWSPDGRSSAICTPAAVIVYGRTGQETAHERGYCAPAWKPDGTFTAARKGVLLALTEHGRLLSPPDLEPALRAGSTDLRMLHMHSIRQATWLSDDRVALIIHALVRDQPGSSYDLLAIFEDGNLVGEPFVNLVLRDLVTSPTRRYLAIRGTSPRGLAFFDAEGRLLARNPIASGHHATWSPDEQWLAIATGGSTYVFRTSELPFFNSDSRPRTIRIPVHAADVEWR